MQAMHMIQKPEIHIPFIENGKTQIKQFDWDQSAEKISKLIQEIL
jgi:hypothetical protein